MEDYTPYLILILLWIVYFALHSLLAAHQVKGFLKNKMGQSARYYRLLYNIFAIVSILPVLFYNALISTKVLIPLDWKDIVSFLGLALSIYGVIVMRLAFRQYSFKEFLGLKQLKSDEAEPLNTEGILGVVRHPLYFGGLLIIIGFWLFAPTMANLITVIMLVLYILVGIRFEERKLVTQYGEAYKKYQEDVPMIFPKRNALRKLR
ncbi:protein-S-isoprenylcysteine O-methyltransferase Ste14 [Catalinimonas alkaloidigena]|uniref:methyltransferase family protein n=1 Tax=Catalinimonas alkaloidigena TaxID=1075417 RepID=UPI002405F6A8|nr:isoprenylcysteine carboxylmethyltransferase family protein [Catalinimonas alkaloidigena]MDF9800411.1 protein-S-isoprenylcysteine O-methyltransferase Ste14 [Catalinimonas alkaloidigena]